MKTEKTLQRIAMDLLKESGISTPPVDVLRVAREQGAVVQPDLVDDEISGGLRRTSDGPIIGVNAGHHPHRQRFTIAHEIGHLILHQKEPVFVDRDFHRDSVSSQAIDPLEIEANKFAAALLMPAQFLMQDLTDADGPLRSEKVEELARRYRVSQQAMTFRLDNLGVPLELS